MKHVVPVELADGTWIMQSLREGGLQPELLDRQISSGARHSQEMWGNIPHNAADASRQLPTHLPRRCRQD